MKTKTISFKVLTAAALAVAGFSSACAQTPKEITVGYFLEWPTANLFAQVNGWYDKELGAKVNWRAFDTGTAMSAAMASGDIQISYSQGLIPFIVATSQGLPIKAVGIAVAYAENDNCVVRKEAGITKDSAKKLEGQTVAVPIGSVSHYKLLRILSHLGANPANVKIVDMAPADGAAALARGDVAMACGWGGGLGRMKEFGTVLMTAGEQEAIGIRVFDLITVNNDFAKKSPEMITKFLAVTDKSAKYLADHPDPAVPVISKAAGMDAKTGAAMLKLFTFPTKDKQLSAYLGGTVQAYTKEVADFLVKQKQIPAALPSYSAVFSDEFYKNVK
ncbi:MAG: ABC transporter substrate-binding protein [Polaromonas sp.]